MSIGISDKSSIFNKSRSGQDAGKTETAEEISPAAIGWNRKTRSAAAQLHAVKGQLEAGTGDPCLPAGLALRPQGSGPDGRAQPACRRRRSSDSARLHQVGHHIEVGVLENPEIPGLRHRAVDHDPVETELRKQPDRRLEHSGPVERVQQIPGSALKAEMERLFAGILVRWLAGRAVTANSPARNFRPGASGCTATSAPSGSMASASGDA